jgi:hypothetical protein
MSPPLPPPQSPEEAFQRLLFIFQASAICAPVHLSQTMSVNLSDISRYEAVEEMEEKPVKGKQGETELVPFDPPKMTPAIFFRGNPDGVFLNDEQNEVFRPAWEQFARLFATVRETVAQVLPPDTAENGEEILGERTGTE